MEENSFDTQSTSTSSFAKVCTVQIPYLYLDYCRQCIILMVLKKYCKLNISIYKEIWGFFNVTISIQLVTELCKL